MGLDVVMLGLAELKQNVASDAGTAAMVKWLQENVPEVNSTHIGEPGEATQEGHRIGRYSDLHVLRGLALRFEQQGGLGLEGMDEEALGAVAEAYYAEDPPVATGFDHLVNHSDSDGFYVPLPLAQPVTVSGTVALPGIEEEAVNVSLGSSTALLAELDLLGDVIGLPGDAGSVGADVFETAVTRHRWPTAAYVWGVLHLYARESVRDGTLIQFC